MIVVENSVITTKVTFDVSFHFLSIDSRGWRPQVGLFLPLPSIPGCPSSPPCTYNCFYTRLECSRAVGVRPRYKAIGSQKAFNHEGVRGGTGKNFKIEEVCV